jgi:hypothetical protein
VHSYGYRDSQSESRDLEDYNMHRAHRYIASLFLTAALAAPVSIVAAEPQVSVQFQVHDKQHKDYHTWNNQEDQAYRGYLNEQHQPYRAYPKQSHKMQNQYWNYRHSQTQGDGNRDDSGGTRR